MRIHEPQDGNFADTQTGIVLFNQFGATVSQDTGRDAQVLADSFNLPVLAVNRPGTAGLFPRKQLAVALATQAGYLAEMDPLGKEIDKEMDRLGITKLVASGRSAGGLGALALARTETVSSLSAVFAAEPVGCENLPQREGTQRYKDYLKQQKELLETASPGELVEPLPTGLSLFPAIGRLISIPAAALYDKYNNKRLFASDVALNYAAYIAEVLDSIDTTLEFAEHSMVVTPQIYNSNLSRIAGLRKEGGAPFEVKQPAGTVHASFDNREYMGQAIEPTISRTLARGV